MLYKFLNNNRDELAARCRDKVAMRPGRAATEAQMANGVPMFLDQLIRTLAIEQSGDPMDSRRISGPAGGGLAISEMGTSAAQHGKALLALNFTVDQVVHDYGDLCQAITDLAIERDAPFEVVEYQTLNRCLDNAIAEAVKEFSYQRDSIFTKQHASDINERVGFVVHELRNLLGTISLAYSATKIGQLSLNGATSSIMERSMESMRKLIDATLADIKDDGGQAVQRHLFSLAEFIAEASAAAGLSAQSKAIGFETQPVDASLAVCGDRELLLSAISNLLQNAIKFSQPNRTVALSAYASANRIMIDVRDHCGGLPAGAAATMFRPFSQHSPDRSGMGLGLSISKSAVEANEGVISVRDMPGVGCIFTISLPRHSLEH